MADHRFLAQNVWATSEYVSRALQKLHNPSNEAEAERFGTRCEALLHFVDALAATDDESADLALLVAVSMAKDSRRRLRPSDYPKDFDVVTDVPPGEF